MINALKKLPNDVESLKAMVVNQVSRNEKLHNNNEQLVSNNEHLHSNNEHLVLENKLLHEKLRLEIARRYASSSEKIAPNQIALFDEAESEVDVETVDDEVINVPAHSRSKKGGRKPLPESLPRVEMVHTLPADEQVCPHDGQALKEIGEVTSEQLDIIPAKIRVIRHIRKQYACDCGHCIKTAALPAQPIPKSMASPGLLAHITVSKYQDALPLYRQETILKRIGVDIPRSTLANWMIKAGELIQPVINLMQDKLLAYDIVQMDETPVQVLNEEGKTAQSKSYLWLRRGGPPDSPIILYDYDPSRRAEVPKRLLAGFSGCLQTDGYAGYNAVVAAQSLIHIGCMAHARRKFSEAVKAQGPSKNKKRSKAHRGLALIQKLYRVEKQVRGLSVQARYDHRQQQAKPILEKLRAWLDETLPKVPPATTTGKALNYMSNEWRKLIRYLDDGRLEIDNNGAENAIRPFVLGRKNWLFSASVKGVKSSANLYSLIETAKANDLEPYAYLRYLFAELPKAETVEAIEMLVPGNLKKDQISNY